MAQDCLTSRLRGFNVGAYKNVNVLTRQEEIERKESTQEYILLLKRHKSKIASLKIQTLLQVFIGVNELAS